MLQRLLVVWLSLLSLLAYFWADLFGLRFDPFLATRPYLGTLIGITMFTIGGLLPRDEVRQVMRRWPTVVGGTAIQYTSMPLLAYLLGHAFRLEHDAMTGVIMVGCVPGAMASNVLTLAARGNVSYSVSLTTTATLLSPLVVPLALWLTLGTRQQLDPLKVSLDLLATVVGPVVAGHVLAGLIPSLKTVMNWSGSTIANVSILWIIAVVVGLNRERMQLATGHVLLALLAINVLGYCAGYFGATAMRLPETMRRALTLEVGMQNAGVGTFLALSLFPDAPATAIPTAVYTFGCMLTGTLLAQIWGARPVGENTAPTVSPAGETPV